MSEIDQTVLGELGPAELELVAEPERSMPGMTPFEALLELDYRPGNGGDAVFTRPADRFNVRVLFNDWVMLGEPTQITVTIEPGDETRG